MTTIKPKSSLKSVVLSEVSFVNSGDNPEAHILLMKTAPAPVAEIISVPKDYDGDKIDLLVKWNAKRPKAVEKSIATSFLEILQNQAIRDYIWNLVWTLEDSISSIMNDNSITAKGAMIEQTVSEFSAVLSTITKGEKEMPQVLKEKLEKADSRIKELEELNKTLTAEVTTLKTVSEDGTCVACGKTPKATETEIDKTKLPESVVKILEKQEKDLNEQRKSIEKMQDETLTATIVAKAAQISHVGAVDDLTKVLKSINKMDPTIGDSIFEILKSADARIRESALLNEGGNNNAANTGSTAVDKINAKAAELRKTNPALTQEKAFVQVYNSDAELRKAYNQETAE